MLWKLIYWLSVSYNFDFRSSNTGNCPFLGGFGTILVRLKIKIGLVLCLTLWRETMYFFNSIKKDLNWNKQVKRI